MPTKLQMNDDNRNDEMNEEPFLAQKILSHTSLKLMT